MPQHHSSQSHSSDRGLFIGFLILMFWLPLPLGSNRPWAWAIMEVGIFSLFLVWLWGFMRGRFRLTEVFYQAKPVLILFILWLVYVAFQCIPLPYGLVEFLSPEAAYLHALGHSTEPHPPITATLSVDPHATTVSLVKSISYVLLFVLTLLLVKRHKRLRWLGYAIVLSGVFQALYGSLMTLSGLEYGFFHEKEHYTGLATGTFINRNHLAGYLELCLAVGIGLLIAQLTDSTSTTWRQRLRSVISWLLSEKMRLRLFLVIMVIALVLTRSRMGNTAFFASMMIAGVIGLLFSRHATRSTVILLVSLIVIDILIVGAWFGVDKVAERLKSTTIESEIRDDVNIYTLPYWQDYLWTGSGLSSFYSVFPRYQDQEVNGYVDHAHNDYLEFGVETGIIGLLILGSIVLICLGIALLAQYKRRDSLCRGIAFSVVMGITAILIHSSVDFNLQIPANAATFIVILAMAWIAYGLPAQKYKHQHKKHRKRNTDKKVASSDEVEKRDFSIKELLTA
jgi:putative inorganic carbon (HCO3(-)) transporter